MQYLAALIAGALEVFAFSPFNWYPLSIFCPTLLFLLWIEGPAYRCAWLGFLFGVGMFGAGVSWVYVSLHDYGNMPVPLAGVTVALFVLYLSLFPATVGALQAAWRGASTFVRTTLVVPSLWALSEWLRGWLLTGFPWLSLGYSQMGWPLDGFAPMVGVYGVSWLTAITAGALAGLLANFRRNTLPAIVIAVAISGTGAWAQQTTWVRAVDEPIEVALVQGNVSLREKWRPDQRASILRKYLRLSEDISANLIVWPESSLPFYVDELPDRFWHRLEEHPADFVFGILERRGEGSALKLYNSVVSVGDSISYYRKHHLVPFGEFLPLSFLLDWILDYLHIPMADFSSWPATQGPLPAANNLMGITICYEDAFPEDVRLMLPQATVLINVSEDAWFGDSLGPHQRLQMARMRALEMGRPMLRAGNTGISAVIDHRGEIAEHSPQFEEVVIRGRVQPMTGSTPYVRAGNTSMLALTLLGLVSASVLIRISK